MGVRNAKGKGQADNAVVTPDGDDDLWDRPDEENCYQDDPVDWQVPGVHVDLQIVLVMERDARDHDVVHFSVELQHGDVVISRIDTAHQTVHRHQFFENAARDAKLFHIRNILSQSDVVKSVQDSTDTILEHAESFYWRWKHGN